MNRAVHCQVCLGCQPDIVSRRVPRDAFGPVADVSKKIDPHPNQRPAILPLANGYGLWPIPLP